MLAVSSLRGSATRQGEEEKERKLLSQAKKTKILQEWQLC